MYNVKWHHKDITNGDTLQLDSLLVRLSLRHESPVLLSLSIKSQTIYSYFLMLEKARKRPLSIALVYWKREKSLCLYVRVEPWSNEGPRDWQNMFGIQGFVISRFFSSHFAIWIFRISFILPRTYTELG